MIEYNGVVLCHCYTVGGASLRAGSVFADVDDELDRTIFSELHG